MKTFELTFDGKTIQGDTLRGTKEEVNALFLHGAGAANRHRFTPLRDELCTTFGISSVAFDFINHGASSQNPEFDSLAYRTNQAKVVIEQFLADKPFSVVASSMGGYIALKLTEIYHVATLVLIVPAVYNRNAYEAVFKTEFTERIRRKDSWVNTDAWELLEKYTGNLLVVSAENDKVIPKPIVNYIFNMAINTKSRKHVEIPEASHQILKFINTHQRYCNSLSSQIHDSIKVE